MPRFVCLPLLLWLQQILLLASTDGGGRLQKDPVTPSSLLSGSSKACIGLRPIRFFVILTTGSCFIKLGHLRTQMRGLVS